MTRSRLKLTACIGLLSMAVSLAGCGSTSFTSAGPTLPAREPTCDFQVFTSSTPTSATEIGTIDVTRGPFSSGFQDLAEFKEEIRPAVCGAGGNAVLAYANGLGDWIKASVLLVSDTPAPAPAIEAGSCSPPCSPGYECNEGICAALCNPACPDGWVCGPDRTCRGPEAPAAAAAVPAAE